jgi:hypothetical protein
LRVTEDHGQHLGQARKELRDARKAFTKAINEYSKNPNAENWTKLTRAVDEQNKEKKECMHAKRFEYALN